MHLGRRYEEDYKPALLESLLARADRGRPTFREQNVRRDRRGQFADKPGVAPAKRRAKGTRPHERRAADAKWESENPDIVRALGRTPRGTASPGRMEGPVLRSDRTTLDDGKTGTGDTVSIVAGRHAGKRGTIVGLAGDARSGYSYKVKLADGGVIESDRTEVSRVPSERGTASPGAGVGGEDLGSMSLGDIAREIERDWGAKVSPHARPYLSALRSLRTMEDKYGADDARTIVAYLLSNVSGYRGARAKTLKDELRKRSRR